MSFIEVCENAARAGGRELLQWQGKFTAQEKGPKDLVTEADLASQRVIRDLILGAYPTHRFVGEEDDDTPTPSTAEGYEWIVDPLDGTCNYVHGLPAFAVSIALTLDSQVIAGVIYDPVAEECFAAELGQGATLNGLKIEVSRCQTLGEALVASSFPPQVERDSPEIQRFTDVLIRSQALRRWGSAALNLSYVACGRLDAYWATSVKKWDVAAGCLLVTEAGGIITRLDGSPFVLEDPKFVASASSPLHEELAQILQSH
ncbi:MAG TPA: inositol monophosphatase [Planctomycetaceae bacterium]|nr:inositol monophosphatase [Blastopirellula sp.]HAY81198.1 inositol monophosphatase [Planctomycetaceae bacterium]